MWKKNWRYWSKFYEDMKAENRVLL